MVNGTTVVPCDYLNAHKHKPLYNTVLYNMVCFGYDMVGTLNPKNVRIIWRNYHKWSFFYIYFLFSFNMVVYQTHSLLGVLAIVLEGAIY